MYVELLAERLGLSPATISFHLKKLENAGVVSSSKSQYYTMYTLKRDIFAMTLISAITEKSDEERIHGNRENPQVYNQL